MDLAVLVDKLQEERSAVALTIFMRLSPTDDLSGLQALVKNKVNIQRFTLGQQTRQLFQVKANLFITSISSRSANFQCNRHCPPKYPSLARHQVAGLLRNQTEVSNSAQHFQNKGTQFQLI